MVDEFGSYKMLYGHLKDPEDRHSHTLSVLTGVLVDAYRWDDLQSLEYFLNTYQTEIPPLPKKAQAQLDVMVQFAKKAFTRSLTHYQNAHEFEAYKNIIEQISTKDGARTVAKMAQALDTPENEIAKQMEYLRQNKILYPYKSFGNGMPWWMLTRKGKNIYKMQQITTVS